MAIGSAFFFAVALLAAGEAIGVTVLPLTLLSGRIVGALVLIGVFLAIRTPPRMPGARVAADPPARRGGQRRLRLRLRGACPGERRVRHRHQLGLFGVTILLARIILREPVVPLQWLGVAIVIAGIGTLSATG